MPYRRYHRYDPRRYGSDGGNLEDLQDRIGGTADAG